MSGRKAKKHFRKIKGIFHILFLWLATSLGIGAGVFLYEQAFGWAKVIDRINTNLGVAFRVSLYVSLPVLILILYIFYLIGVSGRIESQEAIERSWEEQMKKGGTPL